MDRNDILKQIEELAGKKTEGMHLNDFLLTWDKSEDEIAAIFLTAEILRAMRSHNISCRVFDSGFVVQATTVGTSARGIPVRVPTVLIVSVVDSKIARFEEYTDSAASRTRSDRAAFSGSTAT